MKKFFIRFNEIPEDGKSFVFNEDGIINGKREGVSVFDCTSQYNKSTGAAEFIPTLPIPSYPATVAEFSKYVLFDDGVDHPMYLVKGEEIDRDELNLPIITDIDIIAKLDVDRIFPDRNVSLQ